MRHERSHTKIIATIGPASSSKEVLSKMIHEGVDVVRLNFSHGKYEDHLQVINTVLELNKELNAHVALLADLQGPKLRVGEMEGGSVILEEGAKFQLSSIKSIGTAEKAYLSYEPLARDVEKGESIMIDDGKLILEVTGSNGIDCVDTKVIAGGPLSSRKGVNLPQTKVSMPSLTEKDKKDALFALKHHIDWIALSFVRRTEDILDLKKLIKESGERAYVIAKIEKPEALEDLDDIIMESDGIMVARGDLGVEIEFQKVPLIQKSIVKKCISLSKPVIIATQMMESMITNPTPTRAETNDVANAVLDGADTLMLSGETSVGKYPVGTIRNMQKIIDSTEFRGFHFFRKHAPKEFNTNFQADSICYNAVVLAEQTEAAAIICLTNSGYTAVRISSHRPRANIFTFTMNMELLRQLSLVWGVRAYYYSEFAHINEYIDYSTEFLLSQNYIKKGELVVHVGSMPVKDKGITNMLKLSSIE